MKSIIAKIKPQFLSLIKDGVKKHEYRLACPKYTSVNIGDRLVLVSNKNCDDFVITRVNKIMKFNAWESALEKYWKDDFSGVYSDFNSLIKECNKFYSFREIQEYGIEVFEIAIDQPRFQNARFLLDTNIIVQRESINNCFAEVNYVYQTINKFKGIKLYHSITAKELARYKDETIKKAMLVKLNLYEKLTELPISDEYFTQITSKYGNDINSKNDNELLYQVYSGRVDFLITEDRCI